MIFLYRTLENDDEGDPLDHGVVSSGPVDGWKAAAKIVRRRLKKLGHDGVSFKLYALQAPGLGRRAVELDAGLFKDIGAVGGLVIYPSNRL